MRQIPNSEVMDKVNLYRNSIATASLVIHELLYGCLRLPESKKREIFLNYIQRVVLNLLVFDYDLKSAQWHAQERTRLSKLGKTPAFVDGQIASIAYCNNFILVTNNISDFQAFENLNIENWFVS
jgi:tRNA(fMet)-specific endonuclease VapC